MVTQNIHSIFEKIKNFYNEGSNTLHISRTFNPSIKDPDYGDIYEYVVKYYADRGVHDLSSKEKYGLIGIEVLKEIGEINQLRFDDLYFSISYNDGKGGGPSIWSLPEGVEPEQVVSPARVNTAIAEALNLITKYQSANPESEFTLLMSGMASTGETFQTHVKDSSTFKAGKSELTGKGFRLGMLNGSQVHCEIEKSLITIAGPGSGKTQCHVLPNLNTFQGGAIVLDVKGECFLNSKTWRAENIGNILAFAPASKNSRRYNPLSFVSQDPDQVWEDARLLAELLVVSKSQSDPTWENQGRQLLTLLIAYVVYMPEERRNMASVLDLLNDIGLDIALNTILAEGSIYPSAMRRTANNFLKMKQDAEKQYQGVKSGALQHLAIWEGPVVEKLTSTSDWSPLDFRKSNPPTLYLIVQPNQIESYSPLLRVIIAQHVRMLMQHSPDRDAPPILFMLDEMPRLGKMEPIREALEVGRSYRLQLWMFAQFSGQLYDAYGKEIAEGMIESCGVRMYMNPGQETAEKLSKALGTRENMLTGKTEPVVTPQVLTGPEWKDDILVFATGEKPLRLRKSFYYEMKNTARSKIISAIKHVGSK